MLLLILASPFYEIYSKREYLYGLRFFVLRHALNESYCQLLLCTSKMYFLKLLFYCNPFVSAIFLALAPQ